LHYATPDDTVVETSLPAAERADSSEDVQGRIARYLSSGERQTDQANHDHPDVARTSVERIAPPAHVDSAENSAPCHLAFISSPRGYALVELDGPVGYANPSSCCTDIFVDQSAESIAALDPSWLMGFGEM
jgi:hypothetical protein